MSIILPCHVIPHATYNIVMDAVKKKVEYEQQGTANVAATATATATVINDFLCFYAIF